MFPAFATITILFCFATNQSVNLTLYKFIKFVMEENNSTTLYIKNINDKIKPHEVRTNLFLLFQ